MRDLKETPRFKLPTVEEAIEYPLSDGDIKTILGDDIAIHRYPDLKGASSLHDITDNKGRAIVLFLNQSPTSGHWCCLLNKRDSVEFFDPYGDPPETQTDDLPKAKEQELEMDQSLLLPLLKQSGKRVIVNKTQFQTQRGDVNTCGRWCVARLLYGDKPLSYFKRVVQTSGMTPDEFVTGLTANWLKK